MKKIITLLLALTMVLSLCACAGSGNAGGETTTPAAATGLQVGFGKVNITPDFSVGLGGYSDSETRRSEGFIDYIYITCIAATSGEETILIYTLDNCAASASTANRIRDMVTPATGIQPEKIFVGATHSHSCPSLGGDDAGNKYYNLVLQAAVEAAETALADRASAEMLVAVPEFKNMNFIRHYLLTDGTYGGSNFGDFSKGIVTYARETDPRMILLKFDRPEEKQDILMVNWQAHPDHGNANGRTNISADFPGAMREKLGKETGMLVAYFTGASGDQNPMSKIPEDHHNLGMKEYGEKLAELAMEHLDELKPVEGEPIIKTNRVIFTVDVDHSWDHMLAQANEVYNLWKSAGKSAGDALGKTYGFTSSYQARAIRTRSAMSLTTDLELNSFRIGGIGFITGTMEMFSTTAKYARSNSPFENTFIITGCSGYIPCAEAYDYRSYEADTAIYAKGTAEKLAEQYVEMLNAVK